MALQVTAAPPPPPESELDRSYKQLGLPSGASDEEVKAAFRRLAREYHPDVSDLPKEEAELRFNRLYEAYAFIKSSQRLVGIVTPLAAACVGEGSGERGIRKNYEMKHLVIFLVKGDVVIMPVERLWRLWRLRWLDGSNGSNEGIGGIGGIGGMRVPRGGAGGRGGADGRGGVGGRKRIARSIVSIMRDVSSCPPVNPSILRVTLGAV